MTIKNRYLNIIKNYKTEIVLASSTTYLMAGLYFQSNISSILRRNPQVYDWLNPYFIIKKFIPETDDPFFSYITQLAFKEQFKEFLTEFLGNPFPQLFFFLILPLLTLFIIGENPEEYGLQLGNVKWGMGVTAACLILMTPLLYYASTMRDFVNYYMAVNKGGLWWIGVRYGLYMVSWEFLLRGFLYFSLEKRMGSLAVWVQSVPFAVAHLGKPAAESLTCYFGGLVLGYISLKSRSFLYTFLIHWGIYMILAFFVELKIG